MLMEFLKNNQLLVTFFILSLFNVTFSTVKSILTMKGGKWIASFVNAFYYAFYNIMIIYTVTEFPMWQKMIITFICNIIGVFIVKFVEEKTQKEQLWKVEATVDSEHTVFLHHKLEELNISHNYIDGIGKWTQFNIFCNTKNESKVTHNLLKEFDAKFFVSESLNL